MDKVTRVEQLAEKLRKRGGRVTPQRIAILRALLTNSDHPSIEQVYADVKHDFPMISMATVYKTVTLLAEMDEVWQVGKLEGVGRYDATRLDPHAHLMCITCGQVTDIEFEDLEAWRERIGATSGYSDLEPQVQFRGVCPDCRKKADRG